MSDCLCDLDGDWWACIDGAVYGPCEHAVCSGVCEYKHDCDCSCHAHVTPVGPS